MEIAWSLFIFILFLIVIALVIFETVDIMTAKAIKKMRIADERRAEKKKELIELIQRIAYQEIIRDDLKKRAWENALKGNK